MKKMFAFTLAEILITLAVIGIVAALTIPNLVVKYQKRQTVTRLQKIYAEINAAVKMAELEHGSIDTWNYSNMGSTQKEIYTNFRNNYLAKYIKVAKLCNNDNFQDCYSYPIKGLHGKDCYTTDQKNALLTQSGYSIYFWYGGIPEDGLPSLFSEHVHLIVDLDGPYKGKGILGKDIFFISLNFNEQKAIEDGTENVPKKSGVYFFGNGWVPERSRDELINMTNYGCNKNANGTTCGALIQRDGWQIKDDYPWD